MNWIWIVLIAIAYLIMAVITGVLVIYCTTDENAGLFGVLWPVALPYFLVLVLSKKLYEKFFS